MTVNLSLKNVPVAIYERLKTAARNNHRSLNSEIIACLEQAVQPAPVQVDELLARIRKVRGAPASGLAKARDIRKFITQGRP